MALNIPNLDKISKTDPKLGEALQSIKTAINQSVTPVPGNRKSVPKIVNPGNPPG